MFLETDRLIIRNFVIEDVDALSEILADPQVMEFSVIGPLTKEGTKQLLEDRIFASYEEKGYGLYALCLKEKGTLIGLAGPMYQSVEGEEFIEMGYRLSPRVWGHGFATEAVTHLRDYCFYNYGIEHLSSIIDPRNIRSIRVAEKMGLSVYKKGVFHGLPVVIYRVFRSQLVSFPYRSEEEIFHAMEANMHMHMTYLAKRLPHLEITCQPDVTMVSSSIPDDTFNYVIGAQFKENTVEERVKSVVNHYRSHNIPFSWWIGERDTPVFLEEVLKKEGLSLKEDDIGMYLSLEGYDASFKLSKIVIERVLGKKGLADFAKVFVALGGYPHLYEDLYCHIPERLIAEGAPFEMYVGYLEGVPVLTGILVLHANVGGIYYVMTVPEQRRKGLGTEMMKYLIYQAQKKGYTMVTLQASKDGRGLYEKLGFKSLCRFVEYA